MPEEQSQIPQPGSEYAIPALQAEVADLRAQNNSLRDERVYLTAMCAQHEQTIGSLLAQLSQAEPDPESASSES